MWKVMVSSVSLSCHRPCHAFRSLAASPHTTPHTDSRRSPPDSHRQRTTQPVPSVQHVTYYCPPVPAAQAPTEARRESALRRYTGVSSLFCVSGVRLPPTLLPPPLFKGSLTGVWRDSEPYLLLL
ncbi:hypothetical protein E2C01_026373 [Portunus trituberculatus]|uniref:Uncharacterized protein n=1 Tax=Portunus trituberculatus TaxID=210409 RepID=A0A5B7EKR8_PORTR|nr:hypothetical protein [Portunus trituberculatus]